MVQELLLRHRARTALVVCPASLTLKWKAEMADRFGLEFRVVDAATLRELRRTRGLAANPFRSYPRLIVSIDWLKRPKQCASFGTCYRRTPTSTLAASTCSSSTRFTPVRPRGGAGTPRTRNGPRRSAPSRRTSSTACSSRPHRTTATPSRSRLSWSCSTAALRPRRRATAARALNRIERNLREEVARLRDQLDASVSELGLTLGAVERVVQTALELARQPALKPATLVRGPDFAARVFEVPAFTRSWALAAAETIDPLTGDQLPVTFDHSVAAGADDVVLAHLGHRLVAQSLRLLR